MKQIDKFLNQNKLAFGSILNDRTKLENNKYFKLLQFVIEDDIRVRERKIATMKADPIEAIRLVQGEVAYAGLILDRFDSLAEDLKTKMEEIK